MLVHENIPGRGQVSATRAKKITKEIDREVVEKDT
jgi:hypothetical protein